MEILKKHPEIKGLMGPEPLTKYVVGATVALQIGCAWMSLTWSWPAYLALIYVIGATANHSLFLAIHELSHNLGFKSVNANKFLGMLANLPIGIPYSITFKPYHMEHHRYQGDEGIDTDIPTELEAFLVTKTATSYVDHTLRKFVFMFCQIFAYAFRPMLVKPDLVPKDKWIVMNWAVQVPTLNSPPPLVPPSLSLSGSVSGDQGMLPWAFFLGPVPNCPISSLQRAGRLLYWPHFPKTIPTHIDQCTKCQAFPPSNSNFKKMCHVGVPHRERGVASFVEIWRQQAEEGECYIELHRGNEWALWGCSAFIHGGWESHAASTAQNRPFSNYAWTLL